MLIVIINIIYIMVVGHCTRPCSGPTENLHKKSKLGHPNSFGVRHQNYWDVQLYIPIVLVSNHTIYNTFSRNYCKHKNQNIIFLKLF